MAKGPFPGASLSAPSPAADSCSANGAGRAALGVGGRGVLLLPDMCAHVRISCTCKMLRCFCVCQG